jgi:hypothetical protein
MFSSRTVGKASGSRAARNSRRKIGAIRGPDDDTQRALIGGVR